MGLGPAEATLGPGGLDGGATRGRAPQWHSGSGRDVQGPQARSSPSGRCPCPALLPRGPPEGSTRVNSACLMLVMGERSGVTAPEPVGSQFPTRDRAFALPRETTES